LEILSTEAGQKSERPDGSFKDIGPGDVKDEIMTVTFRHDHVDRACELLKWLTCLGAPQFRRSPQLSLRLKEPLKWQKDQLIEAICRDTGKPKWTRLEISALVNKKNRHHLEFFGQVDLKRNISVNALLESKASFAINLAA